MPTPVSHWLALVFLTLSFAAISACSTTPIPAQPETMKELTGLHKVSVAQYDAEKFMIFLGEAKARSVGLMFFGAIGGAIEGGMQIADAKEEGAKFISSSQLTDPIMSVESRFLKAWQQETGIKEAASAVVTDDDSPKALSAKFGSGYLLDFRTIGWTIQPMPHHGFSAPSSYRTTYSARVRLIHLDKQTISWEGMCNYDRDSSLTPILTKADLSGKNDGAVVKAAMNTLAEACGDWLWRQFFGRESGPNFSPAH